MWKVHQMNYAFYSFAITTEAERVLKLTFLELILLSNIWGIVYVLQLSGYKYLQVYYNKDLNNSYLLIQQNPKSNQTNTAAI